MSFDLSSKKFSLLMTVFVILIAIIVAVMGSGGLGTLFDLKKETSQQTQILNATQLSLLEDRAREKQTAHEDKARDEQRYLIVKETNKSFDNLEKNLSEFILESENRSKIASEQRDLIINLLYNVSRATQNETIDTNDKVSKYGPENNVIGRAILELLGGNATEILERDIYSNITLRNIIK